jgi:hypothetical protein
MNSHESSYASLLAVHAKCFIKIDANIPLSDLEGVQSAWINLQTLWLIVNYICLPNFEGAQQVTPPTMWKESFKLIDASNSKGVRASTNIQNSGLIVASIKSKTSFHFCKDCRIFYEGEWECKVIINTNNGNNNNHAEAVELTIIGLVDHNLAFGRNMAIGLNLAFGRNLAFSLIMAFGHSLAFDLIMAFGQIMAFGHNLAFGRITAFGHNLAFSLIMAFGLFSFGLSALAALWLIVSIISLGISFIGGFVGFVGLGLISLCGLISKISLVGFISLGLVGHTGLVGHFGLISHTGFSGINGLSHISLDDQISLVSFSVSLATIAPLASLALASSALLAW